MIFALVLAVGLVELEKPIEQWAVDAALTVGQKAGVSAQDLTMIDAHPELTWWSARYYPSEKVENWGRDTLEVIDAEGTTHRAVQQLGVFPDHRIAPLAGLVPNSDLYRKAGKRGAGVVLLVGFQKRFSLKSVAAVKLGGAK